MKPNQWLTAKVNSAGLVTISSQNQHVVFAFLGATCECGLTPATCNLSSVDLKLKKGADALVALQIFVSEVMMTSSFVPFIIHIRWEEEKAIVDLDSGYQSLDGRLGSIDTDGNLIVTAEGQSFVIPGARLPDGSFNQAEVQGLIFRKYRIVEDPAVALGYLLGTVTVMDLEASASLDLRSREARDLRVMKQELEAQHNERLVIEGHFAETCVKVRKLDERNAELRAEVMDLQEQVSQLSGTQQFIRNDLREGGKTILFHREQNRSVLDALHNTGPTKTLFGWLWWVKLAKIRQIFSGEQ